VTEARWFESLATADDGVEEIEGVENDEQDGDDGELSARVMVAMVSM